MRVLLCSVVLAGCGSKLTDEEVAGLRQVWGTLDVPKTGKAEVPLELSAKETAILLTVRSEGEERTHFATVNDPSGAELFEAVAEAGSLQSSTNGGYLSPVATLNWPRNLGETLEAGTWTFVVGNVSPDAAYVPGKLDFTALMKEDADFTTGRLQVSLVWAGGADDDPDTVEAVDGALQNWRDLYSSIGLTLEVEEMSWENGDLDVPVLGHETEYEAIAEATPVYAMNVVLVPEITDIADVLGVAGDIPGPLVATTRSAVMVNLALSSGPDGKFDEVETRILGETMAHETGHYLGLYHPVESSWNQWDALADTPDCDREADCQDVFAQNLMFPFPVCGITSCTPQTDLTPDQAGVVHGHVGVD